MDILIYIRNYAIEEFIERYEVACPHLSNLYKSPIAKERKGRNIPVRRENKLKPIMGSIKVRAD